MATTAVDKFVELEDRIARTIELVKDTRREKAAVEKELAAAKRNLDRLELEVEDLKQERDVIKNRVEALLDKLLEVTGGVGCLNAKPRTIDVEIYDQKYSIVLKSDMSETDFRELADLVDTRMREIASVASTPDSLKIAVLTALHLAQELREHQAYAEQEKILCRKSDEWSRALEQLLSK